MRVLIVRVIANWDMRRKHDLREGRAASALLRGEVLVAFNVRRNMARIIDCVGAVHDYYADRGVRFDVGVLERMTQVGISLELVVGRSEVVRARKLKLVA